MWFEIIALFAAIYLYVAYTLRLFPFLPDGNYWKERGIREVDTSGAYSTMDVITGKADFAFGRDVYAYQQLSGDDKYCGFYEFGGKVILLKDIGLVKKVLIRDFEYFTGRRELFEWAPKDSCIRKMLFNLGGQEWKDLRRTLNPTFATGKIKKMMGGFNQVSRDWVLSLRQKADASGGSVIIEAVSCVNLFTVDVIALSVFGMDAGSVKNPETSVFFQMANRFAFGGNMKVLFAFTFPAICRWLGIAAMDMEATHFFEKIMHQNLQARMDGTFHRNDFLQGLVDLRKGEVKEVIEDGDKEEQLQPSSGNHMKHLLTDQVIDGQSLTFFLGGYTTVTSFIVCGLHALAVNPEVQEKLREELDKIVKDHGDFNYDDISQATYLDMVASEILRMYSTTPRLERICVKDYHDPETGLSIEKGTTIAIPAKAIHFDARYYPNPEKFDPEHFSAEAKSKRSPTCFLGFGSGPMMCIGMRFGYVQGKTAIAKICHNFLIEPTENTPIPLDYQETVTKIDLKLTPRV